MISAAMTVAALLLAWPAAAQPVRLAAETGLPNPAALFCEQEGGRYQTVEAGGGARGVCILPGGSEVDAWEHFRRRHGAAPGGTQLPNPAAVFCAEQGGAYRIVQGDGGARGLCILPDGREVDAWDHYRERQGALPSRLHMMPADRSRQAG